MSGEDEELKKKYRDLYSKLIRIRNEIKGVQQLEKSLYRKTINTIKINHDIAEANSFSQINDKHNYCLSQLNSTIIKLQNKIAK